MRVQHTTKMWLSNPANALEINPEDGRAFYNKVAFTDHDCDMEDYGWVLLGYAHHDMKVEITHENMKLAAIRACGIKLNELELEHAKKVAVMEEAINKLSSLGWNGK